MIFGMNIGDKVGAARWPHQNCHPDCWLPPWSGTLLAMNDPRAWAGTLAFPRTTLADLPEQEAVDKHVESCRQRGLLDGLPGQADTPYKDKLPVLWDFGDEQRVYWDSNVWLYEHDLANWERCRAEAYAKLTPVTTS